MEGPHVKTVVILGSQGSGKGTQATLLVERFAFAHIDVGAILRKKSEEESDEGKDIGAYLKRGELIPFALVMRLVRDEVEKLPRTQHAVFDGTPRRMEEIRYWEEALPKIGRAFTDILFLELSEEKAIERLAQRRVCTACKAVLIFGVDVTEEHATCPKCGGEVILRHDDTPEAVRERLKNFYEQTALVIAHYEQQGLLRRINGDQPIEEVHKDIVSVLGLA